MIQRWFTISVVLGFPLIVWGKNVSKPLVLMESNGRVSQSILREQDKNARAPVLVYRVQINEPRKLKIEFATSQVCGDARLRAERKIGQIVARGATPQDTVFIANAVAEKLQRAQESSGRERDGYLEVARQALADYLIR